MTICPPCTNFLRCGLIAGAFLATSLAARAVAPDAQDDDLTGTPVSQNQNKNISEATLIANDAGDGKKIKSVGSSTAGATVSWSNGSSTVTYNPTSVAAFIALGSGASADDTFTYVLEGTDGPDSTGTVTVRVNGVNDSPTVTGLSGTNFSTNDKDATNTPLSGVSISDPDTGDELTVTVSISPSASGSFSNATDFVNDGSGNYTFTGSAAAATTKVAALNFVPTENRVAPGSNADTVITVSADDGEAAPVSASRTVRIQSVNDAPIVTPGSNRNMNDNATLTIFSSVVLTDPDFNELVTVRVTFNENKGSFSGSGFTLSGSGASRMLTLTPNQSVAAAQTALRALVFTPVPNQVPVDDTENLTFNIDIDDGDTSANADLTVAVLSMNDAPQLSPATVGPFNLSGGSSVMPFASVALADADFDDMTPPDDITQPAGSLFTATIVLSPSPYGEIVSTSFAVDGTGFTYTYTGTRSQVESAIQAAQFVAPSAAGTFQVALSVSDSSGKANDTSNTVTASVVVPEPPAPGMSGLVAGQQVADNSVIFPFASAAFNNFGGIDRYIEIVLDSDAKGEFDILGAFTKSAAPAPFTYSMTGNSVSASDAIQGLRFRPAANRITGTSETVTFSIRVKASAGGSTLSTDSLTITVTPFNDAPSILGSNPEIRINDDETATPFATITVADADESGAQQLTVTLTLIGEDPDTNSPRAGGGTLAADPEAPAIPGVTFTTSGTAPSITYTIVGSPANVTSFLQALVFTPTADRNPVGARETIRFTIVADDQKGGTAQNQDATVIVTSVNGAPQISGLPPLSQQPFAIPESGNGMAMPFAALDVTDEENITFTIALDDAAKGTLSTTDFTGAGAGTYSMTGTPADISDALRDLVYTLDSGYVFPTNQPGLTTFTLTAEDSTNTTVRFLTIFIRDRNVAHIVTSTADSGPGSLREAIDLAGNGDMVVFDFPAADFPVVIALEGTLNITKNLHIIGAGVDQLAISGQWITGIFSVANSARLTLEQLTLKDGAAASYGGAVSVEAGCALTARYCEFSGNTSGQYGGAIDVFEGELIVENCLFHQNSVTGSIAKAGGAVSIYSSLPCSITNSTFVDNRQNNAGGDGGGALYAENSDLADFFHLQVEHCTFFNNVDAKTKGSAVLSASAGMKTHLRNNIFSDEQGQVLDVIGGGLFDSMGGNIATDATVTTYTVGSQNVTLLDHASDKRSTDPMLDDLADNSGATRTCALQSGSPAIDAAIAVSPASDALGTDQRGFWRGGNTPDIGAFESGAFKRVNINEIMVAAGAGADFIEFYNPRDSETLDMNGLQLWIDGALVHTFTAQSLAPGAGFAWTSTVDLNEEAGAVELRNASGQQILLVEYVAAFAEEGVELVTTGQSINRYPRYEGGFLPHQRVVENVTGVAGGDLTSPGDDVDGSPLNGGNAPPIAVMDVTEDLSPVYSILANQSFSPDLLLNDIEFDRTDTLKITEVMALTSGDVTNQELFVIDGSGVISLANLPTGLDTTIAPNGPSVTIAPDQLSLTYDPILSDTMIALSEGESVTDIRAYTIRDFDETDTPQSRGADDAKKAQNIKKATSYFTVVVTGVNEAPEPVDDAIATTENQAVRLLADSTLLAPSVFNFGDLAADYQDFDAAGNPVTLMPAPPTTALLANDDDVDNDDTNATLRLVAVHATAVPADLLQTTSELGATVKLDIRTSRAETSIVYDPRSSSFLNALSVGETATDSFYYSVLDSHGARGIAKVTITVTGVNDVPKAMDDAGFLASKGAVLSIVGATLLANDTDPDHDESGPDDVPTIVQPFAVQSTLGAALGFDGTTVTFDPTTIPTYASLARNETITDTFAYSITDANGGTSQATVTVIVEGRNDAPVAANDLLEILENATTEVNAANGLLANDHDVDINGTPPDDDPWVLPQRNATTPMGARLDINPDGSYRYDANSSAIDSLKEGELAVETFPYTVIDNFRTTASDDSFKVLADRTDVVLPVLLNDAVVGSSATPVSAYTADVSDAGRVVIESPNHALRDGLIIRIEGYAGTGAYNGVYPVSVIDRDHFSVAAPFVDDPVGTRGTWRPWFVITATSAPDQGGALSIEAGQNLIYTPTSGFHGVESFTYTIEDGVGGQDVGTASIEVIQPPLNGFISASADHFHLGMGESGVVFDVLANDNILPSAGADLTITGIQPEGGATGTLDIINDGKNLRYTPADLGVTGVETFTYTISGGGIATAETTVTFEVLDRTDLLGGSDDAFFVVIGSSDNLLDVLANDPSLPMSPVTSTLVAVNGSPSGGVTGSGGTAGISGNKVSYTPPASILTDTFTYTARDSSGATTTQTVKVRVVPAVADFFATADHYTVVAGSGPLQLPVLVNDGAVQNDGATLQVVNLGLDTNSPPDVERVAISGGTTIRYTPPANAGTETFNYEISIGTIERRDAKITITVVDHLESAPDPEDDFFHVAKNSGPHSFDVLKNDIPYPAAGWSWTIVTKSNPDHGGTLAIEGGGTSLSYTPAPGFFGTETFTYTIADVAGATATATVSIQVGDMITAPDVFAVLEDSVDNPFDVLANDDLLDTYGPDYTISVVGTPDLGGAVVIDGSGPDNRLLYTPPAGVTGEETFTYTVVDQAGATHDETVLVTILAKESDRAETELRVEITGVNDAPVLAGTTDAGITDKQSIHPFSAVSITDLDEAGDQLQTVTVSYDSSYGTVLAPGMSMIGSGTYEIVNTPAAVTAALRDFVFIPYENIIDFTNPGHADVVFTLSLTDSYIATPIVDQATITVTPVNDAPEPVDDAIATTENQAVRLLADSTLLAPAVFDFGDLAADYQDFDASGNPVTLKPAPPTTALLANDDDVDNDDTNATLRLVAVHTTAVPTDLLQITSELGATVKLDFRAAREETSIVYDPRSSSILNALSAGETATDSFYYSVLDRHGARGIAKVTVTVTGVNDVPRATDDSGFVVNEDAVLSITDDTLLANDTDPDHNESGPDDMPVIVQPFAANSTLGAVLGFDGTTITYDPRTIPAYESLARNETLTDTLTYSITDANGGTSQATVTVIVEGRNDAPVAANDLLEIFENATTEVNAANGLLSNDVDVDINGTPPDDDPWVLPQRNVTSPMGAKLDIHPDGSYRYDANSAAIDSLKEGELAVETFPYTVIDNFRTTASDDSFKVLADRTDVVLPVLLNDAVAGTAATAVTSYSADISDAGNTVIESPNHALRDGLLIRIEGYEGSGDYNGVYPVAVIDRDHFSVAVPFADDPAGTRGTWQPWFVITSTSAPDQGGVLSIAGGQHLLYTPTSGFRGVESLTYTIEDGVGGQDVGTVAVEVIQPRLNGFLSASADHFHLGMGASGVVVDVLANDNILPASGADLNITGIQPVAGATGTLEIINDGKNLRYTPADLGVTGVETFTYSVSGGGSATAETTVTFEVLDRTDLLSGSDDAFFVVIGSSNNLLDVLANDPSLPTFPVTSTLVAANGSPAGGATGSGGTVSISGNQLSYTPPASILTDTFTYTARDASGATTTQTVNVRVVPAAADFFATADHYTVVAGSGPLQLPVLVNDGAVQNGSATLQVVNLGLDTDSPPDVERVIISGGTSILYTPPANSGTETFSYEVSIGTIERREAKISITVVDSFESAPDPEDDFFHVAKNSGPHSLDVLKNDIPYPSAGWSWIVSAKTNPDQGGTLAIEGGGTSLSYTPAPGFFGTETFTYTIEDSFGATATATVSIQVGDLITAPDVFAVLEDSLNNPLAVLANDDLLDTYGPDYTISAAGTPDKGGAVAVDGSGPDNRLLYTPLAGVTGEETFTYTVVDQTGATHDETVVVTILAKDSDRGEAELRVEITGVNDLPILTGTANGAITDKQTINPFANASITDLDEAGNQQQTVIVSFDSTFGTIVAPGMTRLSAGVYRRIGTPAQVTASLRGIVFTPYENLIDYINPGQAGVVFNLSVTDGYIPAPILRATTITVTPIDDAPTIITPIPDQTYQVNAFSKGIYLPFHFADVDDDVSGGELTWTVTGNTNPALFDSVTTDPATRLLVLDFAADQAGVSDITVRGTDRGLLFVETTFRVTVEGPPVIVLADGQTKPPTAAYVSGSQSGFRRDYKQSFRVTNTGTLPVSSFIVHVSDLNQPVDGITIAAATYSTNENGTPTNFLDDPVSSSGVSILRMSTYVYDVKYDVPIPAGQSVVVHLTYRVSSIDPVSIRPTIRISLSTPNFTGEVGVREIEVSATREVMLTFNVLAGRAYRLEYSPDLTTWSPWLTPVPTSDFPRSIQFIDDGLNTGLHPSESSQRFYRLVELPAP